MFDLFYFCRSLSVTLLMSILQASNLSTFIIEGKNVTENLFNIILWTYACAKAFWCTFCYTVDKEWNFGMDTNSSIVIVQGYAIFFRILFCNHYKHPLLGIEHFPSRPTWKYLGLLERLWDLPNLKFQVPCFRFQVPKSEIQVLPSTSK